jgi:hypothetical protein
MPSSKFSIFQTKLLMCGDQSASSPSELNHLIVEEEESQHDLDNFALKDRSPRTNSIRSE